MSELKKILGLGDPASLSPLIAEQFEDQISAFVTVINRANASLRYTAANSVSERHDPLSQLRDELISKYQQAVGTGDPKELQVVVTRAGGLEAKATQLASSTQVFKTQWEKQSPALQTVEDSVAQATPDVDVAQPRDVLTQIGDAVKLRDYQTASDLLGSMPGAAGDAPGGPERRYSLSGKLPQDPVVPTDPKLLDTWNNPMVKGDPRDLFTAERMDEVVDMHFDGEGSPELNEAMKGVLFAEPGDDVSKHLAEIGKLRGLDPSVVKAQYERFQQLQGVSNQLESTRGLPADPVMSTRRDEYLKTRGGFLGNQSSLRFGQVVGEATGLDPAFAAMLNPTGGMVGPGMDVLAPADANSPVIWHGIFHDAGGYLLNYQNAGPGYTYLQDKQPNSGRRGADPIQGQVEGISYWYERKQPDRSVLEDIVDLTASDPANSDLLYDRFVKHPINDGESFTGELSDDAAQEVRELSGNARDVNRKAVEKLKNSTRDAADAVQEKIGEASEKVDELADKARKLGVGQELISAAQTAIRAKLQNANSQVEVWEQGTSATFDSAGQYVDDNLDAVDRWADEASADVKDTASDLARDLEDEISSSVVEFTQSKIVQEGARWGINTYCETKQDVNSLIDKTGEQIDAAKAKVEEFYDAAVDQIDKGVARGAKELAVAKDAAIDKLSAVKAKAAKVVDGLDHQIDQVAKDMGETGQNILDAAAGMGDSLADAVTGGTDTLAHSIGSATDFAADQLDRLTNLLG